MQRNRILLIENSAADFYKARIPLYNYLMSHGWDVYALVPNEEYIDLIRNEGVKVIEYELNRKDKGFIQLIKLAKIYNKIIKEYDFNIVHSFRFQPNLINVWANFFNKRKLVLHITGLGIAFSNTSFKYLLLRFLSQVLFQVKLFRADKVIVQNGEDAQDIWFGSYWKEKIKVINGSGINTTVFNKSLFDRVALRKSMNLSDQIIFICVTRLIWEKGIKEMIAAFDEIKGKHTNAKLWIVGWADQDNPRHVDELFIKKYENDDTVFFLGRKKEVKELLAVADVFLYPSYYREGIPRGILEALSMELPVITTTMPGCNLTVLPGQNGYLIAPRSSDEIRKSLEKMLEKHDFSDMGRHSRLIVESKFSDTIIFSQITELYAE